MLKISFVPIKLFWPIFIFLLSFFDSLTYGFGSVTPPSNISSGRIGYHWIEHMLVHILATERQIDFHALKYQDSSKFKIVIFWRFFDLDPTWTLDPELTKYIFINPALVHTYWQNFNSLALRLPVQKLLWQSPRASALVTSKSITSIFFWTVFWCNWVRIEVKTVIFSILIYVFVLK